MLLGCKKDDKLLLGAGCWLLVASCKGMKYGSWKLDKIYTPPAFLASGCPPLKSGRSFVQGFGFVQAGWLIVKKFSCLVVE